MLLLLICILFNTLLVVIFNYFGKYKVNNLHAIVINYWVCVITGSVILGKPAVNLETFSEPYLPYAIALGALFVLIFNIVARTVQLFGVTVSSIFQKMSLLAPTAIAILYFGESGTVMKIVGILLAIAAIFALSRKEDHEEHIHSAKDWIFPIGTFLGSCVIDSILFIVEKNKVADSGDIRFTATLFFFAAVIGSFYMIYDILKKRSWEWKSLWAGIALGIPNFFSIYTLLMVLASGLGGSVVFPINNVGILACAALFGFFLFREQFGKYKIGGLVLAILSIILIANG